MNFLQNLKISVRLGLGFGITVALLLTVAVVAGVGLRHANDTVDLLLDDRYAKVKLITEVTEAINQQARSVRNTIIFEKPADREAELKLVDQARQQIAAAYTKLEPMLASEEGKKLFAALQLKRSQFITPLETFERTVRAGEMNQARELLLQELRPRQLEYMRVLSEFTAFQEALMQQSGQALEKSVNEAFWLIVAAAAVAVAMAAFAAVTVTRSVTRPIERAVQALERVAGGDLSIEIDSRRSDELGLLLTALQATVKALRTVVTQVREGVEEVSSASTQIAQGNADLSSRTEEQAASLQQTAASMEQLTSTVQLSADSAGAANKLAQTASGAAQRGGEVVQRVVTTMQGIESASSRIAEIIAVIDGIAFQTNILALNAAVEAARAGEQGRGFAVVAGEVRTLAQRSAEAAKEIKQLITDSVERVGAGTALVGEAGSAMDDIVKQVRRVSELIGAVTVSSQEQTEGLNQVNTAMAMLDQTTQQNAALVEEGAAAAESLNHQALRLAEAVSVFRTGGGGQRVS